MASVYETAVRVISKPPKDRTEAEIKSLIFWFRKKSDIFRELTSDVVTDIVRNCEFLTRGKDDVIIKQGEKGDCFYIILRGIVSIYINTDLTAEEDDVTKDQHEQPTLYKEGGELDRSKFGNYIAKLETGFSFGELALINKNCIRNASIISDETTDLLVVNRELYNRSLKAAQTAELEQRNEFVRNHMLFTNWAYKHRKQMAYSLKKEKIQFNEDIIKQGQPANVLYFLLSGQAKVHMEPAQHETQYPQFYPLQDPEDIMIQEAMYMNDGLPVRPIKKEVSAESLPENQITVPPSALRRKDKPKKTVEVSVVAGTEILGDIEFALDLKTFLQTVTCNQECEVYALDMKNYERLVTKRNPKSTDLLRQIAEVKLSSRLERLHDKQIPLMRTLLFKMDRMDQARNKWKFQPAINASRSNDGEVFATPRRKKERSKLFQRNGNFSTQSVGPFSYGMLKGPTLSNPARTNSIENGVQDSDSGQDEPDAIFLTKGDAKKTKSFHKHTQSDGTDYSSSDLKLSILEERIKGWHTAMLEDLHQKPGRRETLAAVRLRRYSPEKGKPIFPASRVVFKKKKVQFTNTSEDENNENDVTETTSQISPGQDLTPIHSRRLPQTQAAFTEPRKADAWLHRNILNTNALLPPIKQTNKSQANITMTTIDDDTGTILDVMRRRQDYMRSQITAMSMFAHSKQQFKGVTTPRFDRFLCMTSRSFTLPITGKTVLPQIANENEEINRRSHGHTVINKHKRTDVVNSNMMLSVLADDRRFYRTLLNIKEDHVI